MAGDVSSVIKIYACRHGAVKASGLCYGQTDVETVQSKEASIIEIKEALSKLPAPDTVWTSPLTRCRMLADALGSPYQIDERLMEVSFGQWEGMSWSDIYQKYPHEMDAWGADWYGVAPPGGESAQMLERRVKDWLKSLTVGTHLVFTHAGVIRALRVLCTLHSWAHVIEEPVPYLALETVSLEL